MKSYHRTIEWHRRHDSAMATQAPATSACPPPTADAATDGSQGWFVFILFIQNTVRALTGLSLSGVLFVSIAMSTIRRQCSQEDAFRM